MDPFGIGFGDPMESVLSLQTFGFGGVSSEDTGTCGNTGVCGNTGTCGSTSTCGSTGSCTSTGTCDAADHVAQ